MKNAKRIAVLGNAGSGKSSLSQSLRYILNIPVYHLDKYFWKPNWTYPDPDEYKKIHDSICEASEWIIDGNNLRLLEDRISRADIIIFLDISRSLCFWRIFKRMLQYYGTVAPGSAPGCKERLSKKFIKFLGWVWNFKRDYSPRILELLQESEEKKYYILKSSKEIEGFLNMLRRASNP